MIYTGNVSRIELLEICGNFQMFLIWFETNSTLMDNEHVCTAFHFLNMSNHFHCVLKLRYILATPHPKNNKLCINQINIFILFFFLNKNNQFWRVIYYSILSLAKMRHDHPLNGDHFFLLVSIFFRFFLFNKMKKLFAIKKFFNNNFL